MCKSWLHTLVWPGIVATGVLLGACGGGGFVAPPTTILTSASPSPTPTFAATQSPVAYLVYPLGGPYAVSPISVTLVLAAQGINSSYRVMVSPNPGASSFALNLSPTVLPSPLASPPATPTGPWTYISSSLFPLSNGIVSGYVNLAIATTYTVTLIGCPNPAPNGSCTAQQTVTAGTFQTNCGPPPPGPSPPLGQLASPPNGATGISTAIGQLVIQGLGIANNDAYGPESLSMISASGLVPVGAFTAAPSSLPSPLASPSGLGAYIAAPIPTLLPTTTYGVVLNYAAFSSTPPSCTGTNTAPLGSFTTR